ncbi:MAG: hypothetical protein AB1439_10005 [candidate division FCPU426 bacterium]
MKSFNSPFAKLGALGLLGWVSVHPCMLRADEPAAGPAAVIASEPACPAGNSEGWAEDAACQPPAGVSPETELPGPAEIQRAAMASRPLVFSGLGGVGIKACRLLGNNRWLLTAHGDWILFNRAFLGLAFFRMVSPTVYVPLADRLVGLTITGGGAQGGYIVTLGSGFFLRTQLFLGVTSVFYTNPTDNLFTANDLMVIEPAVYAGVHALEWLHVSAGVAYRYHLGAEGREGFGENAFDSLAAEIRLEFGGY